MSWNHMISWQPWLEMRRKAALLALLASASALCPPPGACRPPLRHHVGQLREPQGNAFLAALTGFLACVLLVSPVQARVFSVGDLHGDYKSTMEILSSLGLVGQQGEWTGGDSILVQTGDVLDRGEESGPILRQLFRLQDEAPSSGGQVILLMGNHELMNLQGDFRYGTDKETRSLEPSMERRQIFEGALGQELRRRLQVVAFLDGVLFVHGGLETANMSVDALNAKLRESKDLADEELFGEHGPFWSRRWALGPERCEELQATLDGLKATRMVVGHTAQADGRVHQRCNGRLVLGDSLISRFYTGTAHPWAVEFNEGSVEAINIRSGQHVRLPNP